MQFLRESTGVTVMIGPFLDDTDGKTAETGLTIAQVNVRIVKVFEANGNSQSFAQTGDATGAVHDENGYYKKTLAPTDVDNKGRLLLTVQVAGALPVWHEYTVLTGNVFDSLIADDDKLDVELATSATGSITAATFAVNAINAAAVADGSITAGTFAAGAIDAAAIGTGAIDADAIAANAINAAAIATNAIDADALAADAATEIAAVSITAANANKIADHMLRRSFATAAGSANGDAKSFRSLLGAVAKLVNKVAVVANTLSVFEADDATALGTQTVTTDPNADAITSVDTV